MIMNDTSPPPRTTNPFTWLLLIGLLLWSLFVTLAVQGSTLWLAWMTDLSKMEESAQTYLAAGLLQLPLLLIPVLLLLLLRERRQAAVVRTMILATIAAGLLLIPRILFPPEAIYLAGWTRFGLSAALGLVLLIWSARKGSVRRLPGPGFGLAIIIALLFLLPWLLYGALGDSFDVSIGNELTELAPNLWGQEIDLLNQMDHYWGTVQNYLNVLFAWQGMEGLVAEEVSTLPGMEELASLMQITHLADSGRFDVIIIDAAPTGSTLQLLSFPEVARWYIEKVFPFQRKTIQIARPMIKRFSDMPIPDEDVFDSITDLVSHLERMSNLLTDSNVSSTRTVGRIARQMMPALMAARLQGLTDRRASDRRGSVESPGRVRAAP
jgi:hypothetical protein